MARTSDRDDPLSVLRHRLREIRRRTGAPHATLQGAVEIALYRLPPRQREIVRRYDLRGERARDVQRSLALSPRQFFRDRRRALAVLSEHVPAASGGDADDRREATQPTIVAEIACETGLAKRAYARSLAQSGNVRCLDALRTLSCAACEPPDRADLLLELAETAIDYSDEGAAAAAVDAVSHTFDAGQFAPAIADWLLGRRARVQAHLAQTPRDSVAQFARATALLRRSASAEPALLEAHAALADALGDDALLKFTLGMFSQARAASAEAVAIIGALEFSNRPKSLEIVAMHATIEATLSGRTRVAAAHVSHLLRRAGESAWSSTATRLGSVLVGLNGVSGDYGAAIRWYRAMAPLASAGARPSDRSGLTMEAAHAFTMIGRPEEALGIIGYPRGDGCPRAEVPDWHAFAAAALDRRGNHRAALREAREALAGYDAHGMVRGLGDAHRLVATSCAKLGNARAAREHLSEARRLTEQHGTPYGLLRTLSAEAAILQSAPLQREAAEYAKLLATLARS